VDIDTVAQFLRALIVIIVVARLLGLLCRRFGQPEVIGEVAGGILLGPTFFHGEITRAVFPADIRHALTTLSTIGVSLFMFLVGTHLAHGRLRGQGRIALMLSLGSMVVPFVFGTLFAIGIVGDRSGRTGVLFCIFVGTAMSITAFPVLSRILTDRELIDTPIGSLALAAAAIGDVVGWSMLAVLVAFSHGNTPPWRVLLVLPFVVLLVGVVRPVLARLAAHPPSARPGGRATKAGLGAGVVVAIAGALVLSAEATWWMGLHQIFGAFLLGAVLPQTGAATVRSRVLPWVERIERIVLLPPFFVVAGFAVDLSGMNGRAGQHPGAHRADRPVGRSADRAARPAAVLADGADGLGHHANAGPVAARHLPTVASGAGPRASAGRYRRAGSSELLAHPPSCGRCRSTN